MKEQHARTERILGHSGIEKLKNARIAVFGVGGVGGHAAEALARAGVGTIDLFDPDSVAVSNINRQIIATHETVGMGKVRAFQERIATIDPDIKVNAFALFYSPESAEKVDLSVYDFILDCIDHIPGKIELAVRAEALGVPIVSAMGAGNKLYPEQFEIADIYKTSVCPLARVMRRELKIRGVKHLTVVYSKETPKSADGELRGAPGSISFTPSVMGLLMSAHAVRTLLGI